MSSIFIGIDLGTTALKAVAVSDAGRIVAAVNEDLAVRVTSDGWRDQSPQAVADALRDALINLRKSVGQDAWANVQGIGLAAQGGSAVICDRQTGEPLTTMYLWNDSRHAADVAAVNKMQPPSYWETLALRQSCGAGLGRLRLLKRECPDLINPQTIYAGAGDFIFFRLTGDWRQDAGNALQIGCYDARARQLVRDPLELVGVDETFVSPMRDGHAIIPLSADAAERYQLPAGLPVVGPYMDHEAGYLSVANATANGRCLASLLQCSLGTAWVGNFVMPATAQWSSPMQLVIPSPINDGHLIVQPLLTGNVSWDWALSRFVSETKADALRAAADIFAERLLPPQGLVCLPWLTMSNPYLTGVRGGGSMIGLSPETTAADMLRALAAGMCFEFYRIFESVGANGLIDGVILGGGASKGVYFRQLFAALFDPIKTYCATASDLAGACGAVSALNPEAGKPELSIIEPPVGLTEAIRERYAEYKTVFDAVCGQNPKGAPIRILAR
ncbi:MAG: FGGY-family carbohydrate kinase [Planctomycetota bacterium]